MVAEVMRKWNEFVAAFNALGDETRGMTPIEAVVLFFAALNYEKKIYDGYISIPTMVPEFALCSGEKMVDVRYEYYECKEFWAIDYPRARITQSGIDYVNKHLDVFMKLSGK